MIEPRELSEIDRYAIIQIECRVHRLIGRYGFTVDDREDLIQQLFVEYLERVGRFSPHRAHYKTFVSRLVSNRVVSLIRVRRREIARRQGPSDHGGVGGSLEAEDVQGQNPAPMFGAQQLELQMDVRKAVASLPPHLREVTRGLSAGTPTEVSRLTGRSRRRVYQWLAEIRAVFRDLGITGMVGGAQ
jgi:RNA polymerase sigma-70 factor (ECF subfamily)